jgi:cytochrome c biogenesis protein ResB
VRAADGSVLLEDTIVPTDSLEDAGGTAVTVPGTGRQFWVGLQRGADEEWRMVVFDTEDAAGRFTLEQGQSRQAGGLDWTFVEAEGLPSTTAAGLPGAPPMASVMMAKSADGEPYLTVLPVDGGALTLYAGQPVRIGNYVYEFEGPREFAGIEIRKDPGATFIWIAAGLLLAGLLVTFYVPRLRLWARVRGDEVVIASVAERSGVFQSEAKHLTRALEQHNATGGEPNA